MPRLKSLNSEDLARWRMASADKELADSSFPGLSVTEGKEAILKYYRILGDLLLAYGLDDDNMLYISPVTGGIYSLEGKAFE